MTEGPGRSSEGHPERKTGLMRARTGRREKFRSCAGRAPEFRRHITGALQSPQSRRQTGRQTLFLLCFSEEKNGMMIRIAVTFDNCPERKILENNTGKKNT